MKRPLSPVCLTFLSFHYVSDFSTITLTFESDSCNVKALTTPTWFSGSMAATSHSETNVLEMQFSLLLT